MHLKYVYFDQLELLTFYLSMHLPHIVPGRITRAYVELVYYVWGMNYLSEILVTTDPMQCWVESHVREGSKGGLRLSVTFVIERSLRNVESLEASQVVVVSFYIPGRFAHGLWMSDIRMRTRY